MPIVRDEAGRYEVRPMAVSLRIDPSKQSLHFYSIVDAFKGEDDADYSISPSTLKPLIFLMNESKIAPLHAKLVALVEWFGALD